MWEATTNAVFAIIEFFYHIVGDWGLAIIIVTLIIRALFTPLIFKQQKSSFQMQKMQPMMNTIRERFADDPVRQNQEMQKIYAESHFNPLAGCLPMLIQIPIFMALFSALRGLTGSDYVFYGIIPDLTMAPSSAIENGFAAFAPYLVLMLIFAFATFIPMTIQQLNQQGPQRNQMMIMAGVMSLFMLWIGWGSPAGVLLYWGTSSLIAIVQMQISQRILKKRDAEKEAEIEVKPIEVNVTRRTRKKRQAKKR